jgi:hypothetical protein
MAMSGVSMDEPLMAPPSIQKAVSHHPAFLHLADQSASAAEAPSKVYQKRNFLFTELKQVMVSVEQCASLFLLEDFLRNRIKTMDDVKTLKVPPSYYSSQPKPGTSASSLGTHRLARHFVERTIERMRETMENTDGLNREQLKSEHDQLNESIV